MRPRTSSTSLAPRSVSSWSNGRSPASARLGVRSHSTAFSLLPIISTAVAKTRARRTVRSDSAALNRECWLKRRVIVRCGMPSFLESAAFPRSSFSASAVTELAGSPSRTSSARSVRLLTARPKTFFPPSTSAIFCDVMWPLGYIDYAIWLDVASSCLWPAHLTGQPRKVLLASAVDGQLHVLGQLVRMQILEGHLHLRCTLGRGLDQQQILFFVLNLLLPAVHGTNGADDVDAGSYAPLHQLPGKFLGSVF